MLSDLGFRRTNVKNNNIKIDTLRWVVIKDLELLLENRKGKTPWIPVFWELRREKTTHFCTSTITTNRVKCTWNFLYFSTTHRRILTRHYFDETSPRHETFTVKMETVYEDKSEVGFLFSVHSSDLPLFPDERGGKTNTKGSHRYWMRVVLN